MRKRLAICAAVLLVVAAACSVMLACCGADRALDFMRYYAAIGVVGAFGVACLLGAVWTWRRPAALLLHLGMALVLAGWIVGLLASPQEGSLRLRAGQIGSVGGAFNFDLKDFSIDYWEDTGGVRQYTSRGVVDGEPQTISVNHPLVKDGWWVYQNSYQEMTNPHTGKPLFFTILLCVKDVGLPLVFLGGILLLVGALLYLRPLTALTSLRSLASSTPLTPLVPLKALAFSLLLTNSK